MSRPAIVPSAASRVAARPPGRTACAACPRPALRAARGAVSAARAASSSARAAAPPSTIAALNENPGETSARRASPIGVSGDSR